MQQPIEEFVRQNHAELGLDSSEMVLALELVSESLARATVLGQQTIGLTALGLDFALKMFEITLSLGDLYAIVEEFEANVGG